MTQEDVTQLERDQILSLQMASETKMNKSIKNEILALFWTPKKLVSFYLI